MTTVSSPLWSLFLVTRRNSSSLIHIKLDNTNFLDGLKAIGPFSPAPQRRYETRRPPTTSWATTSHPESSVRRPLAKRAKTSGLRESSRSIIKRPMVTTPPIEGNSGCRARSFHSELYFDRRLALGFYQSMTIRGVRSPTAIHFTIDGRYGILETRHIAEALHIPFEPEDPSAFRQWSPVSQRDMVYILSRGTSTNSELFWMLPPQPEHGKIPVETAPPVPTPETTSAAPPTISTIPPVAPTTSEPFMPSEFRALIQKHLGLLPSPQPELPASSAPIALAEDTTPVEVWIQPPQDEPLTVTATPEDASSPPEAPTA
ncbi:hypothetical protein AAG906_017281 [Vitis piasezkii]